MFRGQNIVVLTGAGISAESGLATFRDANGLWCDHHVEDVATPEAFARNPLLVQRFYNMRRAQLAGAQPNAAHGALAMLAEQWKGNFLLVTQNVDDLHSRALEGRALSESFDLLHMHGELKKVRCVESGEIYEWEEAIEEGATCSCCIKRGTLRPHIVWFGEIPLGMEKIDRALSECDLFVSIGTSGNVYPAAGFARAAQYFGAHTVELNLEPSAGASLFHERFYGPATEIVPGYVKRLLAENT